MNPPQSYNISEYHKILSPDFPDFLAKYLELPIMQRLRGIGLLCGTDWTKLYKNRFYYSRFDHSLGVALIVWHFTHNKAQTIAGLLHDVSTPVFSHVSDFRKGDALTQTATEAPNSQIIKSSFALEQRLAQDNLTTTEVENYHLYPIADNEIPQLSADRLEYMFPSGMALEGSWSLSEIQEAYNDIVILKNENNQDELGFKTLKIAENYCQRFCMTGHVLQLNENKLTLHLLGQIMNLCVEAEILQEADFMILSESQILEKLERGLLQKSAEESESLSSSGSGITQIAALYRTFRNMTKIEHTQEARAENEYFSVSLKVKQRYINPLVQTAGGAKRLSQVSQNAAQLIQDFLSYEDTPYGCVKLI